jgi:hypothetical protein
MRGRRVSFIYLFISAEQRRHVWHFAPERWRSKAARGVSGWLLEPITRDDGTGGTGQMRASVPFTARRRAVE